ncbi:UNVERIFIED_CONTAM: hypothetical protein GTU68_036312, partial [Idotea baltica]|nr:hypothetical protein [Idotea baltica]
MIDPKRLRAEFKEIASLLETRGLPEGFPEWLALDEERRTLMVEVEEIRARKNKLGPDIAKAKKSGEDADALLAELKKASVREQEIDASISELQAKLQHIELRIPNIPNESVPIGVEESDNREEKKWGEIRSFDFQPKPHWEIGEALGLLDFERAAKLSGARFVVYRGNGARLERALINFMLDRHREAGYTEIIPPLLVRDEAMLGAGQLPKFEDDAFKTADVDPRLFLIPTSEVALCNMHAGEILSADELPIYYTAYTP